MTETYCYDYPRPAVTVDLVVVHHNKGTKVLLVRRGKDPFKNQWALPGGFLNIEERGIDGAVRELEEETGLKVGQYGTPRFLGVYDKPDRDPRGRVISLAYLAEAYTISDVVGQDDAVEAEWRNIGQDPLAFDHDAIINDACKKLGID